MATSTSEEEFDRKLDTFIDKLIEEKEHLPSSELDDTFWKVRKIMINDGLWNNFYI